MFFEMLVEKRVITIQKQKQAELPIQELFEERERLLKTSASPATVEEVLMAKAFRVC